MYSILESIVNFDQEPKHRVTDLSRLGRSRIFNFDYPLTNLISKEKFETMILNHFMMRRIGFETVTLFSLQLNVKLNDIMPNYNKMFEAIENWDILNDGSITEKSGTNNRTIDNKINANNTLENNATTKNTGTVVNSGSDSNERKESELPQDQLNLMRDDSYVSNFQTNSGTNSNTQTNNLTTTDSSTSSGTNVTNNITKDDDKYNEIIKQSPQDRISIYMEFQKNVNSIYSMIFKDLDCLFYQLVG